MHLVNLTTAGLKRIVGLSFALFIYFFATAQENSPYSRYGLGDIVPNQGITNRGMGGISAGYANFLNINFVNPASLGAISKGKNISNTIFDISGEVDIRNLKSTTTPEKFTSTNTLISSLQIAFPLSSAKMERKGTNWGMSFGLRPVTRINYKIEKNERLTGIDSLRTLYEGTGGVNQINVSTGIKIKKFSIGISTGYTFGQKDYSTLLNFINDSVTYYKSIYQVQTNFGGFFFNTGMQYNFRTNTGGLMTLGAFANLQQNLKANQDAKNLTIALDGNGGINGIDTANLKTGVKGTIKMPATYGAGFTYQDVDNHWLVGVDFETSNWDSYRYYGQKDEVQNSWTLRTGVEYYPAKNSTAANKYWSFVKYRAGLYFGPDYIKINNSRTNYAATLGASFPLTSPQRIRFGDFVLLNTAIEAGGRGNKQSVSVKENILRFSFGISMNGRWFQKRNYD